MILENTGRRSRSPHVLTGGGSCEDFSGLYHEISQNHMRVSALASKSEITVIKITHFPCYMEDA